MAAPWSKLRARLAGALILPDDDRYSFARKVFFSEFDARVPSALAYCETEADVQACVRFAAQEGLAIAARSGGHSHAGYSTTEGLVIDVSRLRDVHVTAASPGSGQPHVMLGPGVQGVDALTLLAGRGLGLVTGSCPTVAAGGFVLGGGYGMLSRRHGLACDRLVAARVVLADGRVVDASPEVNPDLFWALRGGGGGNFGIVTQYRVRPVPIRHMVAYALTWAYPQAAAAIDAWQSWASSAPPELGGGFTLFRPPAPLAEPQVLISGGWLGDVESCNRLADRLVAAVGEAPTSRSVTAHSYEEATMLEYRCGGLTPEQCHLVGVNPAATLPRSGFLAVRNRMFDRPMPATATTELVQAFADEPPAGHHRILSGAALGGRINRPARTDTAYVHRTTSLQIICVDTMPFVAQPDPIERDAAHAWNGDVFAIMDPASNAESYQNMPDPLLGEWELSYYDENIERLRAVKKAVDPDGFFRFAQGVSA